jgi:hypothetical protein
MQSREYFRRIRKAAPQTWHPVLENEKTGLTRGVIAVGRGFQGFMSVNTSTRRVCVAALVPLNANPVDGTADLLLRLQQTAHLTRAIPDAESNRLWLQSTSLCPACDELPAVVRYLFRDLSSVLEDDRLQAIITA